MKTNSPLKMKTANMLAIIIAICSFIIAFLLFFVEIPKDNKEILIMMIGYLLGTGFSGVVFFLYNFKNNRTSIITPGSNSNEVCECCHQIIMKE